MEKELIASKKARFDRDLEEMDYRTNTRQTHKRISTMNEKIEERSNEVINQNDKLLISTQSKSKAFLKHYVKVSRGKSKISKLKIERTHEPFTFEEFDEAIKTMHEEKAPGPDGIFFEFVSHLDIKAALVLLTFFNFVLKYGIPSIWRKAIIIPILKTEKPPDRLDSYRPVALTSILCKIYEKMIIARLNKHLRQEKIIDSSQGAFQPHKSSIDQVAFICQRIQDNFNDGLNTVAVFVDFKAAYDLVSRNIVIQKLAKMETPGEILYAIKDFLSQIYICSMP